MKSGTPQDNPSDRDIELAELRAEVARALSTDKPDAATLTAVLARVDDMLSVACAELASVFLDEILQQRASDQPQPRSRQFHEVRSLLRRRNLAPW